MSTAQARDRPAPKRTLRGEAEETSGVTSALLLDYVDRVGGRNAVLDVLRRCGLERCEDELRDETTWFSWETKIALFEATASVLDKPDFLSEMAEHALEAKVGSGLRGALRGLGTTQFVLRNIVRANARFARSHVLELLELEPGHARVRYAAVGEPRYHRLDCTYAAALLAVIPRLFGLPAARVEHTRCAGEGAAACVMELQWVEHPRTRVATAAGGAIAALAGLESTLLNPSALPWVGVAAGVGAAIVAHTRRRWRRAQWRDLQRQVSDSDEVAQRLFTSLQDLVSDLPLDEVVTKLIGNARAAVGARECLLLVREGPGVVCQHAPELPGEATAAVETWANGSPRALETSLLIDDVQDFPALAPLAALADPRCSLACAPLASAGEPLGLLVAVGARQQKLLSRDVAVLEAYAAQVAIALSNARRFQNERSLAARDPLTGLLDHCSFHEAVAAEIQRCAAEQAYSSVVLVDLDNFKRVNDEDGHAAGDRLLRATAQTLSDVLRREDLAFRIGGDEFALLLPRVDEHEAAHVAERVCAAIGALDPRLGASAAVAAAAPAGSDKAALLATADRRLYAAKRDRRPAHGSRPRGHAATRL